VKRGVSRLRRRPLPLWLSGPLLMLGTFFVFLPVAIVLGDVWTYYVLGAVVAVFSGMARHRRRRGGKDESTPIG
jgi:hypothetical protein